jgi:hypothetical protein
VIWETPPTTQALSATGSVQRRKVGSAGAGFRPPTAGSLRPTSCGGVINGPPDASCQRGRHFVEAAIGHSDVRSERRSVGRRVVGSVEPVAIAASSPPGITTRPHGRASCSRLCDGKRRSANSPAFAEVCSAGTVGGRRRVEAASKAWNRVCRPTCDARVGQLACRRSRRPARNQGRQ